MSGRELNMPREPREAAAFRQERRRRIADTALRLFVEKTYDRVKVKDIADACGMSIGSFYDYVSSKEDILDIIVDVIQERWQSVAQVKKTEGMSHWDVLEKTLRRWFEHIEKNSDAVLLSYRDIRRLPFEGRTKILNATTAKVDLFKDLLDRGIEAGEFRRVDNQVLGYTLGMMGHLWPLGRWYWVSHGYDRSRYADEQVNIVKTLLLRAPQECAPDLQAAGAAASSPGR